MSSMIQKLTMRLLLAIGAVCVALPATGIANTPVTARHDYTQPLLAANADQKKTKGPAQTKKKVTGKEKAAKDPAGKKSSAKLQAAQEKKPAGKALKAQTAPTKADVKAKKAAASTARATQQGDDGSLPVLVLILAIVPVTSLCVFGYLVLKEFTPTVYPSGKSYGPHDYLPASKGGAFTHEYHADAMKQWSREPASQPKAQAAEPPVTVTREPLHAKSKVKESA